MHQKILDAIRLSSVNFCAGRQIYWTRMDVDQNFSVNWWLFKNHLRYLFEFFSICSSYDCPNLTQKFWSLLTWFDNSALYCAKTSKASSKGSFWDIFKINFWVIFGPTLVTQLKEFKVSPKKRRFEIFQVALESRWKLSSSWVSCIKNRNEIRALKWSFTT